MAAAVVYVDTDISLGTPGAEIDDGAALILLLASRKTDVQAVGTVFGNTSLDEVVQNAGRLLSFMDAESIPLGKGAAVPLLEDPDLFEDWKNGYGRTPPWELPQQPLPGATDLLIECVRSSEEPMILLALGPLTNLAAAVTTAPDIASRVGEVVLMGGSFTGFSDLSAPAEFNARCDPEALDIVLRAGWPVRLFGLNITRQVQFSRSDFSALSSDHPAAALLKDQAPGWIDRVEAQGWEQGGCSLHDAVAACCLIDASLFSFQSVEVVVELKDLPHRGETTFRPADNGNIRVAVEVDIPGCRQLIRAALAGI